MKAMEQTAPMISVPAGVIKDFISNNSPSPKNKPSTPVSINRANTPTLSDKSNTPTVNDKSNIPTPINRSSTPTPINRSSTPTSIIKPNTPTSIITSNTPTSISKSNTPTPPPRRTPSPDLANKGNDSSLPSERPDSEMTNGESDNVEENSEKSNTEKENYNFLSSITITQEKIPLTNGSKRPNDDQEPKQELKKVRYFGEDRSKQNGDPKDFNKTLEKDSKSLNNDDIMCLSSSVTITEDKKSVEPVNSEVTKSESATENPLAKVHSLPFENSNIEKKPADSVKKDIKSGVLSSLSSDVPVELIDDEDSKGKTDNKRFNEKVKKLPRKELERMVLNLFSEIILYKHELGRQKALSEKMEYTLEVSRKKTAQFHKEIEDLRKVTNRLALEQASRKGQYVAPIRIKRSVGIQAAPHIINKGLQNAQGTTNAVKTIVPRNNLGNPGRILNANPATGFHSKPIMNTGNSILTSGTVGMPQHQQMGRPQALGTSPALINTTVPLGTVAHPVGTIGTVRPAIGGQMLMMTQANPGVMQAIPRPTTAGRLPLGRTSGVMPAPGTLVKVPVTGATQLVAIPQSGGVVLLPNASAATLVVSQVSGVQTVNSPVMAQARAGTITSSPRVIGNSFRPISTPAMTPSPNQQKHPAPLPRTQAQQVAGTSKKLPPQPSLRLSHKDNSIVLSWTMAKTEDHEAIASYQLYAYQEGTLPPSWTLWKKVGSVKALELPMACTLTQFMPGHVYHFAVRAVDIKSRLGPFSEPRSITLEKK